MKYIIPIMFFAINLTSQEAVSVYHEQEGMEVNVYADNNEVIPMTIDLKLTLKGMVSDLVNDKGMIIVPAKSKKVLLAKTKMVPNSREISYGMESQFYVGDITLKPDLNYIYSLPFSKEEEVQVYQGYNGSFSHSGENAIDFGLDIGERVNASRSGIVYKVVASHTESCLNASCADYNNLVLIYHEDGSFAEYVHLKKDGVQVREGDYVNAGDFIAYSGNTGWTSGPHLHFMVFQFTKDGSRKSYKTKFSTKQREGLILKERAFYKK